MVTGYYGLLRAGELTAGSHPIMAHSVFVAKNKKKFQIILHSSKTHGPSDLPQKITILGSESQDFIERRYCPFRSSSSM